MKIPTFPNRPPDQLLSAKFHLMVGPNLFTDTTVTLNITQRVLTISGKWGVNKEIKLNIRDLAEIRVGLHTDKWIELSARAEPLCSLKCAPENVHHFSLVNKSTPTILPGQTVELITKNTEEFKKWIAELKELVKECQVKEKKIRTDQMIMLEHFYEKKIKSNIMMSNFKLKKFIEKININIEKEHLDEIFKMYGLSSLGNVTQEQFIQLMTHFDSRSGLDFIFYKYSIAHSEFMSAEGLRRFFEAEQREQKSLSECVQLINTYSSTFSDTSSDQPNTGNYLSRRSFYRLVDIEQSFVLFSPAHLSVCQDMNQPMSHYFIASSHNSYLVGNQLTSASSYEMYRQILLDGCRCIELDVWDGSSEPEVYHGHTFTSRIFLRGILEVIAEAAFQTSNYPVILSIENHLSPPFQKQMAQMMREILEPYIYLDDVPENQTQFPSPEVFKNRIFIKGSKSETFVMPDSESTKYSFLCLEWSRSNAPKKKKHNLTSQHSFIRHDFDSDDDDIEDEGEDEAEGENVNNTNNGVHPSNQMTQHRRRRLNLNTLRNMAVYRGRSYSLGQVWSTQSPLQQEGIGGNVKEKKERLLGGLSSDDCQHSQSDGQTLAKQAIVTDFSSVINYFKTKKFSNITAAIKEFKFFEMCSRDENASKRIFTNSPKEYRKFTSTNMVRVYPHGLRTNSANYMPLDHWDVGAQMVALNYQTISVAMLINWAQFALNGRSGYVLKPAFLRFPGQVKLPKELPKTMLQVTILCGQFWKPFEGKIELKVSTRVYCPDKEQRMDLKKPESTKVVADNGFNPVWNETFTFDLSNPELSFVQFTLVNAKDFVGHHMISFQAMQRGVRHINLFDHDNMPIPFARIYVKIDYWLQGERKT